MHVMASVARIASTTAAVLLLFVQAAGAMPCGDRCACPAVERPATCHHETAPTMEADCCPSGQSPATATVEPRLAALPAAVPAQLAVVAPPWVPEPPPLLEPPLEPVPLYTLHASLLI